MDEKTQSLSQDHSHGKSHWELGCPSEALETRTALEAHKAFFSDTLPQVRQAMNGATIASLTLVMPRASCDHDDWRRAVAGDLAREYAPKRFNIAAGAKGEPLDRVLQYLEDAPGVTGHYVQAHD
jgi:hypothetical protein